MGDGAVGAAWAQSSVAVERGRRALWRWGGSVDRGGGAQSSGEGEDVDLPNLC